MPGGKTAFAPLPSAPISLPGFDGPFEVLLRLLDDGGLEITRVSLLAIAEQYLAFLRSLPGDVFRLDCLAEFLVVAAHLLVLKSRALLPRQEAPPAEADALDEESLDARLRAYVQLRAAARGLRERQERGDRAFARQAPPPLPAPAPPRLERAAPELLAVALQRLLATRFPVPAPVAPPRVSLTERIAQVRLAVAGQGRVCFTALVGAGDSRADLIITFLAVLELFRALDIRLEQDVLFGDIWLAPA